MGAKLKFDPTPYLNTGHIEFVDMMGGKRSEAWKFFGFLKCGEEYPDDKAHVLCSLCWEKGIPLGFVKI